MKKKKSKTITIRVNPKMYSSGLKFLSRIDLECREAAKEMIDHFKTDGWDLSIIPYKHKIIDSILGRHSEDYIKAKLLELVAKKFPRARILYSDSVMAPFLSKGGKKK